MTPEQYEQTKTRILLLGGLIEKFPLEELIEFVEFLNKAEAIGVGDEKKWKEARGDTDLLRFLAIHLIDIKSVLPSGNKKGGG